MTHRCQCEHAKHGANLCMAFTTQTITTEYGRFEVCEACADCMPKKMPEAQRATPQSDLREMATHVSGPQANRRERILTNAAAALDARTRALKLAREMLAIEGRSHRSNQRPKAADAVESCLAMIDEALEVGEGR